MRSPRWAHWSRGQTRSNAVKTRSSHFVAFATWPLLPEVASCSWVWPKCSPWSCPAPGTRARPVLPNTCEHSVTLWPMRTPTVDYDARNLQKPEPSIELEAGLHTLDAAAALAFARRCKLTRPSAVNGSDTQPQHLRQYRLHPQTPQCGIAFLSHHSKCHCDAPRYQQRPLALLPQQPAIPPEKCQSHLRQVLSVLNDGWVSQNTAESKSQTRDKHSAAPDLQAIFSACACMVVTWVPLYLPEEWSKLFKTTIYIYPLWKNIVFFASLKHLYTRITCQLYIRRTSSFF